MNMKRICLIIWAMMSMSLCGAIGSYRVAIGPVDTDVQGVPLSVDLEAVPYPESASQPVMVRIDGQKKIPIACQLETGRVSRLWFIPDGVIKAGQKATFEVTFSDSRKQDASLAAVVDDKTITLQAGEHKILQYYHAICPAPEGVSPRFAKSGFIHPLWSPEGNRLTQIQPNDHYHHYGIWNPWTKTHVEGREVDFWNIGDGKGTVRFAGILSTTSGPVFGGFKVRQEHVDFTAKPTEKVAMNEVWDVRAFACRIEDRPVWVVDFTSILNNALATTIELPDYRYGGGIGFRATEKWIRDNCSVLTSEGKTRKDADGTRARWCDVNGQIDQGRSGIVFLSHISNREHPEPMRVWPLDSQGNGNLFFEFCPIRLTGWEIHPGNEYVLRYRMIVYDGKMSPEMSEVLWKNFTQPPRAVLTAAAVQ